MKRLTIVLAALALVGSAGMASADSEEPTRRAVLKGRSVQWVQPKAEQPQAVTGQAERVKPSYAARERGIQGRAGYR